MITQLSMRTAWRLIYLFLSFLTWIHSWHTHCSVAVKFTSNVHQPAGTATTLSLLPIVCVWICICICSCCILLMAGAIPPTDPGPGIFPATAAAWAAAAAWAVAACCCICLWHWRRSNTWQEKRNFKYCTYSSNYPQTLKTCKNHHRQLIREKLSQSWTVWGCTYIISANENLMEERAGCILYEIHTTILKSIMSWKG